MDIEDIYDSKSKSSFIAKGEYKSCKEEILRGFRVFQKKYVYKNVCIQIILVILALITQLVNIFAGNGNDVSLSWLLVFCCIFLGIYIIIRPKNIYRKLEAGLGELEGAVYDAEIYTDNIKISTIYEPYIVENDSEESFANENDTPPATVIHLDNSAVEITECTDIYVVYIRKTNVFVIPKAAFTEEENDKIKNKLSGLMGVRYKIG